MSSAESAGHEPEPLAGLAGTIELGGEVSVNRLGFGAMRVPGLAQSRTRRRRTTSSGAPSSSA